MTTSPETWALIPSFDNPLTLRATVERVRAQLPRVLLVDDGSGPEGERACAELAREGLVTLERRARNGGKGAAVKQGLRRLAELGATHALQVDADGQHDTEAVARFLEASRAQPDALVLGYPRYDATVPRGRLVARRVTNFWVALELGSRTRVRDAMVGFRVYPVAAALAAHARGDRMDFDIEIVVRMARAGVPVVNLPVGVRYLSAEEGGVSHFRMLRDNLAFCALHTRLCVGGAWAWLRRRLGGGSR